MSAPEVGNDAAAPPQLNRVHSDPEVSRFLLRASHDLRSAARTVRIPSELLLKDANTPRTSSFEERLGFIVDGARKIDLLVDGIAAYAVALETDDASFQPAPMGVLLRTVLRKLDNDLRDCGAEVVYGELPVVAGSPDRLITVLENLIRNAVAYRGPAALRVHISAEQHPDGWLFSLADNGTGVPAESLESVFMPFERLQNAGSPGVGLGLATCRAIVERHGGRIWAESQPELGTTFRFTLPAA